MELIEIVPNVSEGRSPIKVQAIARALEDEGRAWLLDVHSDPSHHRSVLTAVVRVDAIVETCCRLCQASIENIDLRHHQGEHPRIGALDVLPLVSLDAKSRARTIELAREVGSELARRFELPVFLYGMAAETEDAPILSRLRRGGVEALGARLASGELVPDFGPRQPHKTAGATAVGARDFLIAYNVNLRTPDVNVAKSIARSVRASSGGLPSVQALGMSLHHRNLAQVSMNLPDFRTTSLRTVFEAVSREASARGVTIDHSEIVGLIPAAAEWETMKKDLMLEKEPGILEERMKEAGIHT